MGSFSNSLSKKYHQHRPETDVQTMESPNQKDFLNLKGRKEAKELYLLRSEARWTKVSHSRNLKERIISWAKIRNSTHRLRPISEMITKSKFLFVRRMATLKEKINCTTLQEEKVKKVFFHTNLVANKNGYSFHQFDKSHKLYLHHGRNMPYQPHSSRENPGVGVYNVETRRQSPSFSMRLLLSRFNVNKS